MRIKSRVPSKADIYSAMEYAAHLLCVCVVMLIVASFTGYWMTDDNPYRSYTLQACAWLEGRLDLGTDYPWLELAIVDGKYYVSFPPFPSFVLLPFAAIFGVNTPDHLISMIFTMIGMVYALKLFELVTGSRIHSARYVQFLFLGNGYLFIGMRGWVWYLAQCMCFTLSLMALYYAAKGKGGISLTAWACAVGCRPMVAVYFPLLLALLIENWRRESCGETLREFARKKWCWVIPVILIAATYMTLNYARFGDPFEFGHKYLPEFMRAENGQFSLSYMGEHIKQLFRLPKPGGKNGAWVYDTFDCMAFWLIAPMTISFLGAWLYAAFFRFQEHRFEIISLPVFLLAHVVIICCHRTLGGFQFGNRYIVDMLPYIFYGLIIFKPRRSRLSILNLPLFALGFSVNLIGMVSTYNHWI